MASIETGLAPSRVFVLPFPPTVNNYYATVKGRRVLSSAGRQYKIDVLASLLKTHGKQTPLEGICSINIQVFPPDRKRRDLDNMLKPILDALTHAGVWLDDSQVDDLHIYRCESDGVNKGTLIVEVSEMP